MAQSDIIRRYIDAGLAFTETTRARAEDLVGELVRAGEVQREQTQQWVEEFIDRSRRNYETLVDVVRKEVSEQLRNLPNAPAPDLIGLEQKVNDIAIRLTQLAGQIAGRTPRGGTGAAPAKSAKAPAKKTAARKTATKATAAGSSKSAVKAKSAKATASKAPAKKTTAARKTTTAGTTKKTSKTTKTAGATKASKAGTTGARKAAQRSRPASS